MPTYHPGERAVQERAGMRAMAEKVGRGIHETIPPPAQAFLREQCLAFVGTADASGRVWATVVTGAPGFMQAEDERTLAIVAPAVAGEPVREALRVHAAVGVLVVDFATRRRMRINGSGEMANGVIRVQVRQVYANCPRYIQRRTLERPSAAPGGARLVGRGRTLTPAQSAWIAAADTFVIASAHVDGGADASHRGGDPGFVRVIDRATLVWPDYPGNAMFQTLGNLAVDPAAGLLFLDFERGTALQLTGTARIVWEGALPARLPGAERAVQFTIEETVELGGMLWRGWSRPEPSPHDPRPMNSRI